MDVYSQTLPPPGPWWSAGDVAWNCSAARCIPLTGVAFTIVSSVGSIIGSLLIICTFLCWNDLRTIARMILVFLAISDLLAGIGYVFGAAIYIHYYYNSGYCENSTAVFPNYTSYERLCTAQSFLTTIMPMASFLWTANLAIYLFFSIVWPKMKFTKILMIIFHVTAWGIPLITCVTIISTGYFGPSQSRSSGGWCWIKYKDHMHETSYYVAELMAGKIWEIGVCILALFVCVAIKLVVWRRFRKTKGITKVTTQTEYSSISMEKQLQAAYSKLDQKLIWLPIAFLLLRMWGNIRFFISIKCSNQYDEACCKVLYNRFIIIMQSICDPGQGWSNALLFVIFNQKILHRLCPCLQPCWDICCLGPVHRCMLKMKRSRTRKRQRVIKHVNIVAVDGHANSDTVDGDTSTNTVDGERGDRDPLLDASQRSSNLSTSVLYHSGVITTTGGETRPVRTSNKPKSPSINSKY